MESRGKGAGLDGGKRRSRGKMQWVWGKLPGCCLPILPPKLVFLPSNHFPDTQTSPRPPLHLHPKITALPSPIRLKAYGAGTPGGGKVGKPAHEQKSLHTALPQCTQVQPLPGPETERETEGGEVGCKETPGSCRVHWGWIQVQGWHGLQEAGKEGGTAPCSCHHYSWSDWGRQGSDLEWGCNPGMKGLIAGGGRRA